MKFVFGILLTLLPYSFSFGSEQLIYVGGIVHQQNPQANLALIQQNSGGSIVVRVGDDILGFRVLSVGPKELQLVQKNQKLVLIKSSGVGIDETQQTLDKEIPEFQLYEEINAQVEAGQPNIPVPE